MKKSAVYIILLTIVSFMLTSCKSAELPENLIKSPSFTPLQESISSAIDKYTPIDAKLISPICAKGIGSINLINYDNEKEDECIVFYKGETSENNLGILVLDKIQDKWEKVDSIVPPMKEEYSYPSDIEYVAFKDITGDNITDILIGWQYWDEFGDKILSIYSISDNKLKPVGELTYNKILTEDLDDDGKQDIFVFHNNDETGLCGAKRYSFIDDELKLLDEVLFTDYINGFEEITAGKVYKDKKGIYVSMGLGAHSSYTELLTINDGKLAAISNTMQPYSIGSFDADGDGIIEMGTYKAPKGHEIDSMAGTPWISEWVQWDGKEGFITAAREYSDYNLGVLYKIPDSWGDKFTIDKYWGEGYLGVSFFYMGSSYEKRVEIFSVYSFNKRLWKDRKEEYDKNNIDYTVLRQQNDEVLALKMADFGETLKGEELELYNKMRSDKDVVMKNIKTFDVLK